MKSLLKRFVGRLLLIATALIAAMTGLIGTATPAQAAIGNILPPFDIGQTWSICRGYEYASHTGTSSYGIDLTGAGCDNSASGRTVRIPIAGKVLYYQASYGNLCINTNDGRSVTLTHINSGLTAGTSVAAGQYAGTVQAPNSSNNWVAHIHFQMWSSPGCYVNAGIPFDTAHGARICGAPDLTATGPNRLNNGTWSGEQITGATCDSTSPIPVVDDRIAFTYSNGWTYVKDRASNPDWTKITDWAKEVKLSGNTIVTKMTDNSLWAKDGIDGPWYRQADPVVSYAVAGSRIAFVYSNGWTYVKDGVSNPNWTKITDWASEVKLSGNTIVTKMTDGSLWAKDGIDGSWARQSDPVMSYDVSGSRIAFVYSNGWTYAKDGVANSNWIKITDWAKEVRLSGNTIVTKMSDSSLWAMDNLNGSWYRQADPVVSYDVSGGRIAFIYSNGWAYVKDGVSNSNWTKITDWAGEIKLSGNTIATKMTDGSLWAKDGIDGSWYRQADPMISYAVR